MTTKNGNGKLSTDVEKSLADLEKAFRAADADFQAALAKQAELKRTLARVLETPLPKTEKERLDLLHQASLLELELRHQPAAISAAAEARALAHIAFLKAQADDLETQAYRAQVETVIKAEVNFEELKQREKSALALAKLAGRPQPEVAAELGRARRAAEVEMPEIRRAPSRLKTRATAIRNQAGKLYGLKPEALADPDKWPYYAKEFGKDAAQQARREVKALAIAA